MRSRLAAGALGCWLLSALACGATAAAPVDAGADAGSDAGADGGSDGGEDAGMSTTLFEAAEPWTRDVSAAPKSGASDTIIGWLANAGGWGGPGGKLQIDFSLQVLQADASTPMLPFAKTGDFYDPDCDFVKFPVPPGGALEGEGGYACTQNGDCHLLVVHRAQKKLYEMWRANLVGGVFNGGCAAVWDLTKAYPDSLRGDDCTSADAGGFPITAMLFNADEVAKGSIDHALRFILPNSRIRHLVYVHPATHSTNPTSGGPDAPPYGVRMRLRADFPLASLPNEGARVIARALQRYGMFLADGGNIPLTGQDDRFTTAKWSQLAVDSHALYAIKVGDLEVVELGALHTWVDRCTRN